MSEIAKIIGNRIKDLRNERGWSQEDFALRAEMNRSYIGQLERGEKSATVDSLEKVVDALEISFEDFFKHIKPAAESGDNSTLILLINKLNELNPHNQKVLLELIDVLLRWKP